MKKRFGTDSWRARAEGLKSDSHALYLACRDPRVPLLPKLVAALAAAYALSPIDLIPDFVPVLGYLDDLILVPAGLALAIRLIPPAVMAEHRARAAQSSSVDRPPIWLAAAAVAAAWLAGLSWLSSLLWGPLQGA